jgi:hypothetical protein
LAVLGASSVSSSSEPSVSTKSIAMERKAAKKRFFPTGLQNMRRACSGGRGCGSGSRPQKSYERIYFRICFTYVI